MNHDLTCDSAAIERCPSILVIGLGNPMRSDDGIGWRVARELRTRVNTSMTQVIECYELGPEMAETIRAAALVVFVDAAVEGFPGEVRHSRLECSSKSSSQQFSHGRTPAALLALAADLYGVAPEVHLFTVCGSSFGYGENFSPLVAAVFPSVVAEIEGLLETARSVNPLG